MFVDTGSVPADAVEPLVELSADRLRDALPRGEDVGWLAFDDGSPERPVAGAGVLLRLTLPFPRTFPGERQAVAEGRQAIVLNVYTHPAHRRRGLARRLMAEVLRWAPDEGRVDSLVLHASEDGRSLTEPLGFAPTNEMRLMDDPCAQDPAGGPGMIESV